MNFADAVGRTPEIAECLKNGLQALERQDRNQINTTPLEGKDDNLSSRRNRFGTYGKHL